MADPLTSIIQALAPQFMKALLPMPSQSGSAPTTQNPSDMLSQLLNSGQVEGTDGGIQQGYNQLLMQQLMNPTLQGHMYPPSGDDYVGAIGQSLPTPEGTDGQWYPGYLDQGN